MLDKQGHLKLTDFGLSKIVKDKDKTRTLCGTPHFVAPEMLLNARTTGYDRMVDWWSLGVVIYEMSSKTLPFEGGTFHQLSEKIINDEPVYPVYFSPELKSLLAGLLTKDPLKRFGNDVEKEVKQHPFFAGIKWDALLKKQIQPPGKEVRLSGPLQFMTPGSASPPPVPKKDDTAAGPPPSSPKPPLSPKNAAGPPVPKKDTGPPPVPAKNDVVAPAAAAPAPALAPAPLAAEASASDSDEDEVDSES